MPIKAILPALCASIADEPTKIHAVLGGKSSGKSSILPLGLIKTPRITASGQVAMVEPSHPKVLKSASLLGQGYYRLWDPSNARPDIQEPLCGPYLAVGYRTGAEDGSSKINLALYSTKGTFLKSLLSGSHYGCVLLSRPTREDFQPEFEELLREVLAYRSKGNVLTVVIGSDPSGEERLASLVGAEQLRVHLIPQSTD